MSNKWWITLIKGLVLLALGWVLVQMPNLNRSAIGLVIAALGVLSATVALRIKPRLWGLLLAEGIIDFFLGVALLALPFPRDVLLPVFLALWAIIGGLNQLLNSIRLASAGFNEWWLILILAITALTLGVLLFTFTISPTPTLILILGILFFNFGLLHTLIAFALPHSHHPEQDKAKPHMPETTARQAPHSPAKGNSKKHDDGDGADDNGADDNGDEKKTTGL